MLKRCLSPLTLVNQLALIVLLSTAIGVTGMAISGWLVQGVQGNAHAINEAGSLRMQSYRLLAAVPLTQDDRPLIDEMERTAFSPELENAAIRAGQQSQLNALQGYWHTQLQPGLKQARSTEAVAQDVAGFVSRIDALVSAFDQTTELRIDRVVMVHRAMALFMGLLLIFTIVWLRARLLNPWKQLLAMARAVTARDFTQRTHISGRNEMAMLGQALNTMSAELSESYAVLEQRVQEKTAGLEQKNEILSFLWQANRRLHMQVPLCERLSPVLNGLQKLTLLRDLELRVYDVEDEENHQEFTCQSDMSCDDKGCHLCPRGLPPLTSGGTTLKWRLTDSHTQYGILLATLPTGRHLSHDQHQLVDTLVEQLTATLALDRHQEKQQQLIVMEERATIARELHDSIAQSLSCMKMQVSCLQMQDAEMPDSNKQLLSQIRNELNTSWVQLRELLTTFRLTLNHANLPAALQESLDALQSQTQAKLHLDCRLSSLALDAQKQVHLLQIVREAVLNAIKHAQASEITVSCVTAADGTHSVSIRDNGIGIGEASEPPGHYGLNIMRERAQRLGGVLHFSQPQNGGTLVSVTFPAPTPLTGK